LAAALNVSRRTVFRDLELLSTAGIACSFERTKRCYTASGHQPYPPLCVTLVELDAFLMALQQAFAHRYLPDPSAVSAAASAIGQALPEDLRGHYRRFHEALEVCPAPRSNALARIIADVLSGAASRQKVLARYRHRDRRRFTDMTLHPYRLVFANHGWHLIAFAEQLSCVATFRLDRFMRSRVLNAGFTPDRTFDLDDYLGNAWWIDRGEDRFHVRIRFSKDAAVRVNGTNWHATQRTTRMQDGSLIFEADVDGLGEIVHWVLGFGDQARVLAPPALGRLVGAHARHIRAMYNGSGSDGPTAGSGDRPAGRESLRVTPPEPLPHQA
jgi:predicted DNA-binding transcriptional regulator YafY